MVSGAGASEAVYDVRIRAWASGQFDWFPLASAVPADTVAILRETAAWEIEVTDTDTDTDAASVAPVTHPLTEAEEYAVWMRYPSTGGKVPWGLIADRLTPEQAAAYVRNPRTQLNVQPAADRTPPPVEDDSELDPAEAPAPAEAPDPAEVPDPAEASEPAAP
ncbi:hypothetical protein ACL03H_21825 [Saccharopolyspora sp. MS10]|uniref:hypothetical protein n=1 Tax=Saccharopolyspora sp. MS10 TaxID=3385973 RepID=UPI0039A3EBC5